VKNHVAKIQILIIRGWFMIYSPLPKSLFGKRKLLISE
jgi:hypothetical protein